MQIPRYSYQVVRTDDEMKVGRKFLHGAGARLCASAPQLTSNKDQAYRAISTGKLQALLPFHIRPINVMVYHGSQGILVSR